MKQASPTSGRKAILGWVVWIGLSIGSFFAAAALWTPIIAKYVGPVRESRAAVAWIGAVFGTWIVFLVPLIITMYSKVDKVYEDARLRREQAARRFRSISIERSRRVLPSPVAQKISAWPETIPGGHLVHLTLADGSRIPHVFVAQGSEGKEILGIYGAKGFSFQAAEVRDAENTENETLPAFLAADWLRLDGVQPH
jgi:hypothetical protein